MARYSKRRGGRRSGGLKRRISARTRSRAVAGRRRSMRSSGRGNAGQRTVRLVIETTPTPAAIRTDNGFAVAAPPPVKKPIF